MKKRWWYWLVLIPLLYRPSFATLLIFFLPGFTIIINLFKKSNIYEKIALSIALSLSIAIINGFILNFTLGLNQTTVFLSLLTITLIPLIYYIKTSNIDLKTSYKNLDKYLTNLRPKNIDKKKAIKTIIIILCLTFLAVKVYSPHFSSPYPMHMDEWTRLLETTSIMDKQSFKDRINPQFIAQDDAPRRLNPGFQFLLSQYFISTGLDPVTFFQYLPAMFALCTAMILFAFLYSITNFWTASFSIIMLSFLKTNDNTLGISLFVALTMTYPFLYAIFYSLNNAFEKNESFYLLIASLSYFSVLITHEQTGAAFAPIIAANILILLLRNIKNIKPTIKGTTVTLLSIIIPFLSLYISRGILWKGSLDKSTLSFLELIVWQGSNSISYGYNFIQFYGPLLLILAIIGAIFFLRHIKMSIFIIWSSIALCNVLSFHLYKITYFSYIERARHHAILGLIPLSAYGLYTIIRLISDLIKNPENNSTILTKKKFINIASISALMIMMICSIFITDNGTYLPKEKMPKNNYKPIAPIILEKDYKAISYLREISYKNVVLADPIISASIYPISKNFIIASRQNTGDGFGGGKLSEVSKFFTSKTCIEKYNIAYQNNVKYIISKIPLDCQAFKLIYSKDFRYIYELK